MTAMPLYKPHALAHPHADQLDLRMGDRVRATVGELRDALGGERSLVIAREITKKFETISVSKLAEAPQWLIEDPNRERGEFVLLVDAPLERTPAPAIDARELLMALIEELPPARAARVAAAVTGLPRDALYAQAVELKAGRS